MIKSLSFPLFLNCAIFLYNISLLGTINQKAIDVVNADCYRLSLFIPEIYPRLHIFVDSKVVNIGPFYVFKGESCSNVGLHEILYLGLGVIGQGDSDGIDLAGNSQDVLVVDLLYLDGLGFGDRGFYLKFYFSVLSYSVEGEGQEKDGDDC